MAYNFPNELSYISTQTASTSTNINFTTGISSNFSTYLVTIRNFRPSGTTVALQCLFSTDGGSSYLGSNYNWSYSEFQGAAYTAKGGTSDTKIEIEAFLISTGGTINGDITFYNLSNSLAKSISSSLVYDKNDPIVCATGYGMNTGTTAVNAIRFQMDSGTLSSGSFKLFGVNE